jgi:O-methyltransferase involved in polyketide biosynthesis
VNTSNLQGVARTLLVPLACRALESPRPDAIIHDPHAVELYNALGGSRDFLLGMRGHDLFAAVMRVRQFDHYARDFLARYPGALVVDIGCGLDTRFHRLDDGTLTWLGVDLPEIIQLRRQWLPDAERCTTIAQSMFDLSWLEEVRRINKPVIFLAEGVFPYFSSGDVKPMVVEMARRFPAGELVFDAAAPFLSWLHNHSSSVLKQSGTRMRWDAKNPAELEAWGLRLLGAGATSISLNRAWRGRPMRYSRRWQTARTSCITGWPHDAHITGDHVRVDGGQGIVEILSR